MVSDQGRKHELVRRFLLEHEWVGAPLNVEFLAAGEYNENYLVKADDELAVFRINHGTQLGIGDQISYEFEVLRTVEPSGVTPAPLRLCRSHRDFPNGALLMRYLPGRPLDYRHDAEGAAKCLARIHSLPYDAASGPLIVQADPIADIIAECLGLLDRYSDHPLPEKGRRIRAYMEHVRRLATRSSFAAERLRVVNTEVNSGNFLVDGTRVRLVDWEKAVASYRYQDLGHFLVPTTTLWKTDFTFSPDERRRFLAVYHELARPPVSRDELDERTQLLEETILLRAFSWVYMAYAEYASGSRALANEGTFATITHYLDHVDEFLGTA
ncbi:MAG: phosphotransferase family protein [Spirochaetota bacterium]